MKKLFIVLFVLSLFTLGLAKKPPADIQSPDTKELKEGTAKDFTLKNLSDKDISLKDYKDKKVVLLVFWAIWCQYCVQEIPEIKKLKEEMKGKDFEVLAIDIQESKEKLKSFAEKKDIKYEILLDSKGDVARSYNVEGIPDNIVIDKNGNIKHRGEFPSKDLIEKLLK